MESNTSFGRSTGRTGVGGPKREDGGGRSKTGRDGSIGNGERGDEDEGIEASRHDEGDWEGRGQVR